MRRRGEELPGVSRGSIGTIPRVLNDDQLREFGTNGHLVVHGVVGESLLGAADGEIDRLMAAEPPAPDTRGKHFYFKAAAELAAADAALRASDAMTTAEELVAPHRLFHGYGHIQIALNIPPYEHRPGAGHLDGYHDPNRPHPFTMLAGIFLGDETTDDAGNLWVWPGSHVTQAEMFAERGTDALDGKAHAYLLDPPLDLGEPVAVLGRRGDLLLAHYLLSHNSGGNLRAHVRRMLYYRLSCAGIDTRWERTMLDPFLEYAPVHDALKRG